MLSQGHTKQLQMRNKHRLGTWNIRSMLQLGKVQLLGGEMIIIIIIISFIRQLNKTQLCTIE